MSDPLHFLLIGATVGLLIEASRRTMAGSLTLGAVVCLVAAVVILSVRNRSLKSSMEEERNLSLKSLDGISAELEACKQDVQKKKTSLADLGTINQQLEEEKSKYKEELEQLKVELSNRDHLAATVEELHADIASLTEKAEHQQLDLDAAQQELATLQAEKAKLEAELRNTLRKLDEAAAAKNAAVPVDLPAVPVDLPAVPVNPPADPPANPPAQEGAAPAVAAVKPQLAPVPNVEVPVQVPEQQQ